MNKDDTRSGNTPTSIVSQEVVVDWDGNTLEMCAVSSPARIGGSESQPRKMSPRSAAHQITYRVAALIRDGNCIASATDAERTAPCHNQLNSHAVTACPRFVA